VLLPDPQLPSIQPISQLIPYDRRFPAINGSSIAHKKRQIPHKNHLMIIFLWAGPTICSAISKGLAVSLIRPSGGGSVGEWLGSDRASPTLFFSALYNVTTIYWLLVDRIDVNLQAHLAKIFHNSFFVSTFTIHPESIRIFKLVNLVYSLLEMFWFLS
jgi:hypothetical protein